MRTTILSALNAIALASCVRGMPASTTGDKESESLDAIKAMREKKHRK